MIGKILSLVFGSLMSGSAATKTGGALSSLATISALSGGVLWLFGPGREWSMTVNALELSGIALGAGVLLEFVRRAPPPGAARHARRLPAPRQKPHQIAIVVKDHGLARPC